MKVSIFVGGQESNKEAQHPVEAKKSENRHNEESKENIFSLSVSFSLNVV